MLPLLAVALGGALGSVCRYLLAGAVQSWLGLAFPYGTLAVNVLGCLIIGFFLGTLEVHDAPGPMARYLLVTGFLGGFTTYSTYAAEAVGLLQAKGPGYFLAYVGSHLMLGLGSTAASLGFVRWLGRS